MEGLYPLSPHQNAIFQDIVGSLAQHQRFLDRSADPDPSSSDWAKYRMLRGKPGTGKSQVLIRGIHHALQQELKVLLAAAVALLAQGYRAIFRYDLEADTIHAAFHVPIDGHLTADVNFELNKFDMVAVDEASLVSPETFHLMATTFNRLNVRPVVVIATDKCRHQPLQTVDGRVSATVSILNDQTFNPANSVKQTVPTVSHCGCSLCLLHRPALVSPRSPSWTISKMTSSCASLAWCQTQHSSPSAWCPARPLQTATPSSHTVECT